MNKEKSRLHDAGGFSFKERSISRSVPLLHLWFEVDKADGWLRMVSIKLYFVVEGGVPWAS